MSNNYSNDEFEQYDSYATKGEAKTLARQAIGEYLNEVSRTADEAAAGRARAIEEVSKDIPDFKRFASENAANLRSVLESEPVLRDAVVWAETNPALQGEGRLSGLYKIAYRLAQVPNKPGSGAQSMRSELRPESPRPGNLSEESLYAAAEASKRLSLTAENRKKLISDLESKGVLDFEF
jgi:hypothetical protein